VHVPEERQSTVEQRVTLITLAVDDLERSIRFYRDGLGWRLSGTSQAGEIAFFQLNGLALALFGRAALAEDVRLPADSGWGGVTLAQNLRTRDEVDAAFARALAAGATELKSPTETEWGGYSGYVADPDGHPWELALNPYWPLSEDGSLTLPS
jgi:uncharacterized protein